jgi:hypothetical protein
MDNIFFEADINTIYSLSGGFIEVNDQKPFKYTFNTNSLSALPLSGNGFALDLGLIFDINNEVNLNLALTNLFGNIYWGNKRPIYKHRLKLNSKLSIEELQDQPDSILYNGVQIDTNIVINKLKTKYPSSLIIGSELSKNKFDIATNLKFGFNNEIGNSTKPRISLAMKLKPIAFISLLSGFSFGGYENFQWGTGFNLKIFFLKINCAYSEYGGVPGNAKGLSTSISSSIFF